MRGGNMVLKRETKLFHIRLTAWQRRLLIGAVIALTSQFYLSVWAEGFRVSTAAILYPVLLCTMMRSSHRPDAGAVTGIFVIFSRVALDLLQGTAFWTALKLEYPGGAFYLCYDCMLCLLIRDRRMIKHTQIGFTFFLCDFCSNVLNLLLSDGMHIADGALGSTGYSTLLSLAGIALGRSAAATAILWIAHYYHQLLQRQEHEQRYQRLFIMTAELKNELYFLKKDSEDIEGVMTRAYRLYERLGELGVPEEDQSLALSIAREVHEIKKDNLRIIRGIEGEVADVYDQEEMRISDLFRILEDSTRRMLGEQRADIRLDCWCEDNIKTTEHYRVLSVLKNLVTNAVEAIQSDTGRGSVRVEEYLKHGLLVLKVTDDGPGISRRAMPNLFKVGFSTKFDPDTGNINRGVGLPAVQFIVDELEGSIQVDSQPGRGAQFTVKLPLRTIQGDTV